MFSCFRSIYRFTVLASILCLLVGLLTSTVAFSSGGAKWNYDVESEHGPEYWGDISGAYKACKEGLSQSPIDLTDAIDVELAKIDFNYKATRLNIINTGHSIEVKYDKGSYINVDREKYKLLQFHFHTPSEHTIDGVPSVMEMHLVHKSNRGKLAVIGVLFNAGVENVGLDEVWANLPEKAKQKRSVGKKINVIDLMPNSKSYYAYFGSLTTPPCSEGVKWYVLRTPLEISEEQVSKIESIIGQNSRLVQPLNDRELRK